MRRFFVIVPLAVGVPTVPALAAPADPSLTGESVSDTAQERQGRPEEPSVSFPFQCPPPPPFRGEAP
jgi:hypothetical protein